MITASGKTTARLALGLTALMIVIVGFSAWLRLLASGLGCADWPACYGPPDGARATPAWAMAVHRAAAMLFGAGMLWLLWRAWRARREAPALLRDTAIALALTLALTVLGLYTPMPRFPLVTLANVTGGMLLLALLGWIYFGAASGTSVVSSLRPWARGALAVVGAQIALGAWVSANYAANACAGLLDCGMDFTAGAGAFDPLRRLAESGPALTAGAPAQLVQGVHRLGAVVAFLYIGVLAASAVRHDALRRAGLAVLALVLLQPVLGIATVLSGLPLWLVTAHNAGAMALLLALVYLNHLLTPK
jgi:cytochrome c oxidase assembly protein subunit 15